MGPQQRQHLVTVLGLPDLIVQVVEVVSYQSNGEYSLLDLQAPLSLIGMLFRRSDTLYLVCFAKYLSSVSIRIHCPGITCLDVMCTL